MNFNDIFAKIENEKSQSVNDRVLIVDSLNSFLRVMSSIPTISSNGEHVGGIVGFLRSIGSNIRDFNPSRVVLVFDGKGGSLRRKKLFPEYKQGRAGKHNFRRDVYASYEEEQESMRKQMRRIIQYLNLLPVQILCLDHIEADDTIAYLTMQYFSTKGSRVRIVSTDRDFLQLVSENVEVYSPVKKKLYHPETITEEFGIHPDNYLLYRMVDGDMGDGIPGVNGIGLKTLLKSFPEMIKRPLNFEYLLEQAQVQMTDKGPKIYKTILAHKDELDRNFKLMQLAETDIGLDSKLKIINQIEAPIPKLDKVQFRRYIAEDYLSEQFKNLESWMLQTFTNLNVWANQQVKDRDE